MSINIKIRKLKIFFAFLCLLSCNTQNNENSITTAELRELLGKKEIQLVDVRTPEEIENGFIESAIFINYFNDNFLNEANNKIDKSKPVYLYCRSGNRSRKALELLKDKGFNVINVLGGYNQWKKEN